MTKTFDSVVERNERKGRKKAQALAKRQARELPEFPPSIDCTDAGEPKATYSNAKELLRFVAYEEFNKMIQAPVLTGEKLPWSDDIPRNLYEDATLRAIRDYLLTTWGAELKEKDILNACLWYCDQNQFHPVMDYLNGLQWDNVRRINTWQTTYLGTPCNEYTSAVGRLFLLGAVARIFQPGIKFDTTPIYEGPQGTEKSGALAVLGGDWYSNAELGSVKDKDAAILLRYFWIFEMPEMNTMRRADANDLKAYTARAFDTYRPPFGRANAVQKVPRHCVFAGTINPEKGNGYFSDSTGNRRWWPVETSGDAKLVELERDRDQLWAEAVHEWKRVQKEGRKALVLPRQLWGAAAIEQKKRMTRDSWSDELVVWLDSAKPERCYNHKKRTDLCNEHPQDCIELPSECFDGGKLARIHSRDILRLCLGIDSSRNKGGVDGKRLNRAMTAVEGWTFDDNLTIGEVRGIGGYVREVESNRGKTASFDSKANLQLDFGF
jgi:hypothetical protein